MQQFEVVHGGTMRFWGDWFGRPMDNFHVVTKAVYDKTTDILRLEFQGGETCTVLSPIGITTSEKEFFVKDAYRVIWSHPWYGGKTQAEYRSVRDYVKQDEVTVVCTYTSPSGTEERRLNPKGYYAVEIC